MRLLVATVSVAGALLALPSAASANGRMCMVLTEASWLDQRSWLDEPGGLEEASWPGTDGWVQAGQKPRGGGGERVLWCQSADDPRCSPVNRDTDSRVDWLHAPVKSRAPAQGDVADPSATEVQHTPYEAHALPGIRRRVERPPRR